jgi:hypothetical protein
MGGYSLAQRLWTFIWLAIIAMPMMPTVYSSAETTAAGTVYKSEMDELLTIETVTVLPFTDNLQGIYSRPLENHFTELVGKMHRWNLLPVNSVGPILSPEDLEDDIEKAKSMAVGITANAFFACRISKGPNGVTIVLSLFLTKDAKLLAKATLNDAKRFEISDLKKEIDGLLGKVVAQIPYQGRVLSRDGQRVTVNVGRKDGIQAGQVISVIQIIGATRHPKFNFLIRSEKEIIGRVKVVKVDDTLSFGTIVTEKEKGVVGKNAKISGLDFVAYPSTDTYSDVNEASEVGERKDGPLSFGKDPSPWVPKAAPTFGMVGARFGNSIFNETMNLTGFDSLRTSSNFAPSVTLDGEIWISSDFSAHAMIKQGMITIKNPRSDSSPSSLNQQLSQYEFYLGYNFRFSSTVWGPGVELLAGYMNYRLFVDDSNPQGYTTMTYTGLKFGVRGQLPFTANQLWGGGAEMFMAFRPKLTEDPVTSGGDSKNTANSFGVFGYRKITESWRATLKLELEQYTSSFSGRGTRLNPTSASSSSQRHTTLSAGVAYLF